MFDRYDGDVSEKIEYGVLLKKMENAIFNMLKKSHKDVQKHKIVVRTDRFNFACPYCGDSRKSNTIKRGYIFLEDMHFKCWNGGCRKGFTTFGQMLVDFRQSDDFTMGEIFFIRTKSQISDDNPTSLFTGERSNDVNDLKGIDNYAIDRGLIMNRLRIIDVECHEPAMQYLTKRNQLRNDNRHFGYSELHNAIAVMNLTADRTKVIGIQLRFLTKQKQRFMTYLYSDMIKTWLYINADEAILYKMDRICLLYNILSTNLKNNPCIFEAAFDSHHFMNSMATLSASTKIKLPHGLYFYDNTLIDEAGKTESIKMLKEGYKVFLWGKFIDDYPHFKDCKDLDDMVGTKKKFEITKLYDYFSNNHMDMIYL